DLHHDVAIETLVVEDTSFEILLPNQFDCAVRFHFAEPQRKEEVEAAAAHLGFALRGETPVVARFDAATTDLVLTFPEARDWSDPLELRTRAPELDTIDDVFRRHLDIPFPRAIGTAAVQRCR